MNTVKTVEYGISSSSDKYRVIGVTGGLYLISKRNGINILGKVVQLKGDIKNPIAEVDDSNINKKLTAQVNKLYKIK